MWGIPKKKSTYTDTAAEKDAAGVSSGVFDKEPEAWETWTCGMWLYDASWGLFTVGLYTLSL